MFNIHILEILAIGVDARKEIYDNVKDAIPSCLRKDYKFSEYGPFCLPLFPNSDEYSYIVEVAKKMKLHLEIREKTVYTPKEEENCEYFYTWISDPLAMVGKKLNDYGTKFWNGCDICTANKTLCGDAFIDRKLVKKKSILQLSDSIIAVSKQMRWLIEENNLTGFNFDHMLKDFKGREMEDYFCIEPTIDNILPSMHEQTWFWEWQKKECEHKQYFLASNAKYSRSSMANAKDLNFSYEFSYGLEANRFVIVSKKVRDIFEKNKIRVGFMPVNIVNETGDGSVS